MYLEKYKRARQIYFLKKYCKVIFNINTLLTTKTLRDSRRVLLLF